MSKSINERVARMIGYEALDGGYAIPNWRNPSGLDVGLDLPDFERSLDACREVLEWIFANRESRWLFLKKLVESHGSYEGIWQALRATPKQICIAALAVGESQTASAKAEAKR